MSASDGAFVYVRSAVKVATEEYCVCGGQGPTDEPECAACRIYHWLMREVEQAQKFYGGKTNDR